jgi:molybdate transport system ATP-binding protein
MTVGRLAAACRVAYPGFTLDAELDLPLAGVTALFGPSGSGKTTLLRVLAGLERRPGNRVELAGEIWQDDARGVFVAPHRRPLGFVFQDAGLFPHLSVRGNLAYGFRRVEPGSRRFAFDAVVAAFDLAALLDRAPVGLSGGERQRVALARAVLTSPRLMLLDEPLASLDAARKEEILPFIERLVGEFDIPVLYVSHAIEEVLRLAATLVLVAGGRIVAAGPIEEITARLDLHEYTGRLDAGAVLKTRVKAHEPENGITRLAFRGGDLIGPSIDLPVGAPVNVRVRSRDVALSLEPPRATSILNVLPGRVAEIGDEPGPTVHVLLDVGSPLWARIMRKSIADLGLEAGKPVYALLKAVAVDQRSLGRPTAMDRSLAEDR